MSTPDLVTRLEALERENRRLRRTGRVVLGLGALGLTMSMAAPAVCKTVWAERFVLKDGRMRERVVFDAYSQTEPTVTFKDREGGQVARMRLAEDGELTMEIFQQGAAAEARFQLVPEEGAEKGDADVD